MSGSVVERISTKIVNEEICHDDRPLSWNEADCRAGRRLDRRKAWAFIDGNLCKVASWTAACSGCSYSLELRGAGCSECGYRGVRRQGMWIPA